MNRIKSEHLFQLACASIIIGLLCSRFLISIAMILFLITGLWGGGIKNKLIAFVGNKYYLAIMGIFLLYFISGLWSMDTEYFWNRMRIKLPILFLPFAFCSIPPMSKFIMRRIMWIFVLSVLASVLWSSIMFFTDAQHYVEIYSKGQILPTPIHHIRYSIMVSMAICLAIYMLLKAHYFEITKGGRLSLLLTILCFTLFLHFLAVRSGLFTLYILFAYLFFFLLGANANRLYTFGIASITVVLIVLSILFVPTIKNKIDYMKYSLELFSKNQNIRDLSDSRRLGSIYAGIHLSKSHPLMGVGAGDIMFETNDYLKSHYPELINLELLPHNQYILTSASIGIPGMLLFILFTITPLFYLEAYDDFFFVGTQLMFFASFMVEHTIESQIGVALYIFILLFAMKIRESINLPVR